VRTHTFLYTFFWTASLTLSAAAAFAAPIFPSGYDMNNGHGVASSGSFNYWDLEYTGIGATNVDNAPLSGGLGNLTDGVVTTQNWLDVENAAGTGPYVGWRHAVLPELSMTFHFAGLVDIDTIRIHADDSGGLGGVQLPSDALFTWAGGSALFSVTDPDPGTAPSWLEFSPIGITGVESLTVQLGYLNEWIFLDEIAFSGTLAPAPEPATSILMALALAGVGLKTARRRA
jgi:PEP-CTERM motif